MLILSPELLYASVAAMVKLEERLIQKRRSSLLGISFSW